MKNHIFTIFIIITCANLSLAQESGKWRGGLETGFLYPYQGAFGILGAAELKYNLQKNMNVGLKLEATSFMKSKSYSADLLSFSATYDYYLHYTNRQFSPFIGAGAGYYFCKANDYSEELEEKAHSKYNNPTGFIRTGFELWRFRMSLAYNLIRKSSEANQDNRNSDYVSLTFGFYLGGGKWKNNHPKIK